MVARCEEAQGFWVCPKEGGREPQEAKGMGSFIIEVNVGSRLERIFLNQV